MAFCDAIPRNDDLFIIAPPHHNTGIIFNTRVTWGVHPWGGEYPPAIVVVASSLSNSRFVGSALGGVAWPRHEISPDGTY